MVGDWRNDDILRAVTIDFHDTLFICDEWFQLEVHHLVAQFLSWYGRRMGQPVDEETMNEATVRYRRLRQAVIEHGEEIDAVSCVLAVTADMGMPVDRTDAECGVAELMRATLPSAYPRTGAVELVHALQAAGVRLGIVSSAVYHPFIEWCLERYHLSGAFSAVVSSASCGVYKSRPGIYQHALALLGAGAEYAIHIGDSYRFDVLGARRAGLKTVWLDKDGAVGKDHMADLVVPDLTGIADDVLRLLRRDPAST